MGVDHDETKWVGVRPTDPAIAIPVTESAPLTSILVSPLLPGTTFKTIEQTPITQIKVEPLAADTVFKTATEKRSPATADLQAIHSCIRINANILNVGAPSYSHDIYTVPPGYYFQLSFIQAMSAQSDPTYVQFSLVCGGGTYVYSHQPYGLGWSVNILFENVLYDDGDIVRIQWIGTLATTDIYGWIFGHLIKKY